MHSLPTLDPYVFFLVSIHENVKFYLVKANQKVKITRLIKILSKIRRGPKLEGYAITNFGYSSGTEGKSHHEKN